MSQGIVDDGLEIGLGSGKVPGLILGQTQKLAGDAAHLCVVGGERRDAGFHIGDRAAIDQDIGCQQQGEFAQALIGLAVGQRVIGGDGGSGVTLFGQECRLAEFGEYRIAARPIGGNGVGLGLGSSEVAGFGAPGSSEGRTPLWLRGELAVARSRGHLVLVDGAQREADEVAQRVARGIPVVRKVLPDWTSPVVVEVPASAADLDETLGATPGTYGGIAAVTAGVGTGSVTRSPRPASS